MKDFKEGNLEIKIEETDKILMTWIGRSEDRDPSAFLNPYLSEISDAIAGKELEVEFSKLEYMNSSTVPPIIQLIKKLNTVGVTTRIFYDKNSKWQSASFKALETIARSMKCIEVVGK